MALVDADVNALGATSTLTLLGLALVVSAALRSAIVQLTTASAAPAGAGAQSVRSLPRLRGTLPLLGNTLQTVRHAHRIHDWFYDQTEAPSACGNGAFYLAMLGAPHQVVVATPALLEDVNKTHFASFDKGPAYSEIMRDVLGDGIFAVDGAAWRHQRKVVSHLFTQRALRETLTESVHTSLGELHAILDAAAATREPVDLAKLFFRFSTETFVAFALGVRMDILASPTDHPFQAAFDRAEHILLHRFFRPRWLWRSLRWLGIGYERELAQCVRVIDDTIYEVIAQSLVRGESPRRRDIVSFFIASSSTSRSGSTVDSVALRDLVVNTLVAGRDSTAVTMSWFFHLLSTHPHVEAKIRDELRTQAPELARGDVVALGMDDSQKLVYLEAALRETTRLYPPVPLNIKQANRDVVLHDGTFIGAGWRVISSSYSMARLTSVWGPDAKEFKPERWLDADTGKLRSFSPFQFTSFHSGPRACLGMNMALTEMRIVVSSLLSKYRVQLAPQTTPRTYAFALLLSMDGPLLATLEPVQRQLAQHASRDQVHGV